MKEGAAGVCGGIASRPLVASLLFTRSLRLCQLLLLRGRRSKLGLVLHRGQPCPVRLCLPADPNFFFPCADLLRFRSRHAVRLGASHDQGRGRGRGACARLRVIRSPSPPGFSVGVAVDVRGFRRHATAFPMLGLYVLNHHLNRHGTNGGTTTLQ